MSNGNKKSWGTTSYFSQWGGERSIPEQFVAAMERAEQRTSVPVDTELSTVLTDVNIVEARFEPSDRRTNEKTLVVILKKDGVIGPLMDFRTTDQGQTVQVDSTMFRTADTTFDREYPSATQDVAIRDLGNGWSIQEVAVSGTWDTTDPDNPVFVPGLFQGIELQVRRDDPVPDRHRLAMPITQTQEIVEGTVELPTLGANDLQVSERQLAQHRKILTTLTRDGVTLPHTLVSKQTNQQKQLVVVTDTYRVIGTAPDISATQDVQVLQLDDTHEVVITEVIAAVFGAEVFSKEIEDLLPQRFRGVVPTTLTRQILAGTASAPTLGAGELKRTEQQVTLLTKMVEVLSRAGVSFPITVTDEATTTEYGGGKVNVVFNIAVTGTYDVDEGEGVVSSRITQLGEGHELRETVSRQAGSWPSLPFARFDTRLQTVVSGTKQVVAKGSSSAGLSGSTITEVREIDNWREERIITTQPIAAADAYFRLIYGNTTNVDVPPELVSLQGFVDLAGESGQYTENGTYALSAAQGSGSISLRGTAQTGVSAMADIGEVVKIPRTNNIPCLHVIFYVPNGTNRAGIITILNALTSLGVTDWPKFWPQQVKIWVTGGKAAATGIVSVSGHDSITTDYLGALKYSGWSRSSGNGYSFDVGRTTKVVTISPTIHGALTIPVFGGGPTSIARQATAIISIANLPVATVGTLTSVAGCAWGIIDGAAATKTTQTIPDYGLYVHRLVSEPDANINRLRVLAEIVDFADITPD